jgi:hypothetical protein
MPGSESAAPLGAESGSDGSRRALNANSEEAAGEAPGKPLGVSGFTGGSSCGEAVLHSNGPPIPARWARADSSGAEPLPEPVEESWLFPAVASRGVAAGYALELSDCPNPQRSASGGVEGPGGSTPVGAARSSF